jgi:hypothetical protein
MKSSTLLRVAVILLCVLAALCLAGCPNPSGSSGGDDGLDAGDDGGGADDTGDNGDGGVDDTDDDTDDGADDGGGGDTEYLFADAGADVTIDFNEGTLVTLDGSGSSHSTDAELACSWTFLELPDGSSLSDADLTGAAQAVCTFDVSSETAGWETGGRWHYTIELTVTDPAGVADSDEVIVTVVGLGDVTVIAE